MVKTDNAQRLEMCPAVEVGCKSDYSLQQILSVANTLITVSLCDLGQKFFLR